MLRGAAYIRVSTTEQTELSPDAQKRLILEFAKKNDIIIDPEHIYVDAGISGTNAKKRPSFIRMISAAKSEPKPFDIILVHEFSRFARNRTDSIVYKSMLKKDYGIKVISITESSLQADDKMSMLMEAIIEAMDEYYSINLSEEVKKGLSEKTLRGDFCSYAPFGYKNENRSLVIDEEKAPYVKKAFLDFLYHDKSAYQIAQEWTELGLRTNRNRNFEARSIKYILSNITYAGYVRWNRTSKPLRSTTAIINDESEWITQKGNHEPIIDKDIFDQVQAKLDYNKKVFHQTHKKQSPHVKHWLTGILKCELCGRSYTVNMSRYTTSAGNYYEHLYFKCSGYAHQKCSIHKSLNAEKLVPVVLAGIKEVLDSSQNIDYINLEIPKISTSTDAARIQSQIKRIDLMQERAKTSYLEGIDTLEEYKQTKSSLDKEKLFYEEQLANIEKVIKPDANKFYNHLSNVYNILTDENVDVRKKNDALKSVISKIYYRNETDTVDIYFIYPYSLI